MVIIALPAYNEEETLPPLLEQIRESMEENAIEYHVVVVNDGSTDDSDEVMQPYLPDPRIVYVKQGNRGQAGAKNTGVRTARGEFVAFLDADDVWKPDKLTSQARTARRQFALRSISSRRTFPGSRPRVHSYLLSRESAFFVCFFQWP